MTPRSEPRAWRAIGRAFERNALPHPCSILLARWHIIGPHARYEPVRHATFRRLMAYAYACRHYDSSNEGDRFAKSLACYWLALEAEEEG